MIVKFTILCFSKAEIWIDILMKALFFFFFLLTSPLSTILQFDKISANGLMPSGWKYKNKDSSYFSLIIIVLTYWSRCMSSVISWFFRSIKLDTEYVLVFNFNSPYDSYCSILERAKCLKSIACFVLLWSTYIHNTQIQFIIRFVVQKGFLI